VLFTSSLRTAEATREQQHSEDRKPLSTTFSYPPSTVVFNGLRHQSVTVINILVTHPLSDNRLLARRFEALESVTSNLLYN
jgi:hypothetical protein